MRVSAIGSLALILSLSLVIDAAGATASLPKAGSPTQVAAAVAASTAIKKLPATTLPSLADAPNDKPGLYYPVANKNCVTATQCEFGNLASPKTIVLWGDSHAQMWLPALVAVVKNLRIKLVLIWHTGCPVVALSNTSALCISTRTSTISLIKSLHPALVLLANRNAKVYSATNTAFSNAQWQTGMETTIKALKSATTKVAVVQDITIFNALVPNCLAAFPTSVQSCSVPDPNPKFNNHQAAEKAAAVATKAGYISTKQWLCPTVCSPIIGNMIAYFDADHVAATYAEYLAIVWLNAIKPMLA
jgi:hypothetical protein